ncbi:MAG: hypothetical protein ACTSU5_04120 [Promethearchaeota archaeon]
MSDGTTRHQKKNMALHLASLVTEATVVLVALQYWWWGQVYPKTLLLLDSLLVGLLTLPGLVPSGATRGLVASRATDMLLPSGVATVLLVLARLRLVEYVGRYPYSSPLLLMCFIGCLAWMLGRDLLAADRTLGRGEAPHPAKVRDAKALAGVLLLDLIGAAAFVLVVLNLEGISKLG